MKRMQLGFQAIRKMTRSLKWKALPLLSAVCFAPTAGSADESPWKNGRHALTVDERKRTFILEIPPELKAGAPLVMVFHGTGGSAAAAQRDCGFSALIERQNFVAVYPNATRETNPEKTPQFQVDYEFQRGCKVDDLRFIKILRDRLVQDLKLDPDAVFATGMSNGGDMSYFLASQKKPIVKAIAPVAGTMMASWGKGLNPTRQTSILAIHSRDDKITLWEGDLDNRDGWGAYYGIEAVMNLWAKGLALLPAVPDDKTRGRQLRKGLVLRKWLTQKDDTEMKLYEFESIGHTWPPYLGNKNVSTAEEIWRFFDAHRTKSK